MPHLPDSQHSDHDLELIAAHAAGDATGSQLERATALVSACTACAALHHDLRAIAAAMPELPAPTRPRDFRLTPDQAASLRPSGIRGLLATLSGPKFSFATPLGTGLAALGIVGVLVASGGLPSSGASTAPQPETALVSPVDGGSGAAGAAGAALASEAPAAEAPEVAAQASEAPSAAAAVEAPAASEAASARPTGGNVPLEDQPSPERDTAGGGDTAAGGEPKATAPAASDDTSLYLGAGASPDASRAADIAPQPAQSPDTIHAAPVTSSSASTSTAWFALGGLLVAAGLSLVVLRWGARRIA